MYNTNILYVLMYNKSFLFCLLCIFYDKIKLVLLEQYIHNQILFSKLSASRGEFSRFSLEQTAWFYYDVLF